MSEEFEKWAEGEGYDVKRTDSGKRYAYPRTHFAYLGWQASRKQALEQAVGICKDLAIQAHEDATLEEDERYRVYAKKYCNAAAAILALQQQ